MPYIIPVEDRISTYPGRVTLTPVSGEANTYDLKRADMPIIDGTPVNKKLFDSKADAMTEEAVVYVSPSGNDLAGDGTVDTPYATIQKALDSIPKNLNGHTVTIDIASGTYEERVAVNGFIGGKLKIGVQGRSVVIRGFAISGCSFVETNISNITKSSGFSGAFYFVDKGSSVLIASAMKIEGSNASDSGISATTGSTVYAASNVTLTISNCYGAAVQADLCSFVSVDKILGDNNIIGVSAVRGSIVSYNTQTMTNMWGNNAASGGLVLTGSNSSSLSGATLDL